MRQIRASDVSGTVAALFQEACVHLAEDVILALEKARVEEESPLARDVLDRILENSAISAREDIPLCQDTGSAVVFLELGQEACIVGGDLYAAVDEGVARGYTEGYLRKSMLSHPFSSRVNTGDNTPAIIYTDIVPGDKLRIIVMPKGGGAENMAQLGMLTPASGRQGVLEFVVRAVDEAGSNPCPPVVVGVGVGGTADRAMLLAKKSLLRQLGEPNSDPEVAELERDILERVNKLGIGAMGYGGRITALAVHVETFPAHVASLPVAVNLQCHSARHREAVL
jgi:fumarate hydratase subunit alpha